ncbi:MAG: sugar phosphate isomerase/epimerase [Clostridia bacterium]|nr:sugar phosphate isomerase/epimerase [Clostridia bacterium]
MIPVYASNGAFITRHNGRDYHLISKYAPMIECDGFEFLMYFVWENEVADVRRFLKNTHFRYPVMHLDKQIGETLSELGLDGRKRAMTVFQRDLDTAEEIGAEKLVLHLWNGPFSDAHFSESIKLLPEMYDLAQRRKMTLTVENVTCVRNVCLDHLNAMRAAYPFARFTYDTKMAQLHGENELLAAPQYIDLINSGAVSHLHVNDTKPTPEMDRLPIMHIGEGIVRFDAFFDLIRRANFAGTATVESTSVSTDGTVDIAKLNHSIKTIRENLNK